MIVTPLTSAAMAGFVADLRMAFAPDIPVNNYWSAIAARGPSYAIKSNDGRAIGAAGFCRYDEADPRKAEMWALFSADAGPYMAGVTRRTLSAMDAARDHFDHIRALVDRAFPHSRKWVLFLGFTPTGETIVNARGAFDVYEWVG